MASNRMHRLAVVAMAGQRVRRRAAASAQPTLAGGCRSAAWADSPGLLCTVGADGHFRQLSPAWAATLGWSIRHLTGRPVLEFVHAADRRPLIDSLGDLAGSDRVIELEHRWLCRGGGYKWLHWLASSQHACDGQFRAVVYDVTELRYLRGQLLEVADRERERLGRELHDGLCQNLAGIAALGSALSRRLATSGAAACVTDLAEIGTLLQHAVVHVRDLAHGLCPAVLRSAGIADALQALADNVQALFGAACDFDGPQASPPLDADTALHLYRITQQAVHNAISHGRASRVEITLGAAGMEGMIDIRDDGTGLPELDLVQRSLGMQSMAYRAALIGGALTVQRNAPQGTRITCRFPWPASVQPT